MSETYDIGVIVGRFQVEKLHKGHTTLIERVLEKHDRVIIFIGCDPVSGTKENPLDYVTRMKMIRDKYYNRVTILPLKCFRSDIDWSNNLDEKIREIYKIGSVCLYGGTDSFIHHYHGIFKYNVLDQVIDYHGNEISATMSRKNSGNISINSKEFRAGVIYSTQNQYNRIDPVVDVAVLKGDKLADIEILMGTKFGEKELRLIGGYVDATDADLNQSCRREVEEESGAWVEGKFNYVNSYFVDDWRYKNSSSKMLSMLFYGFYSWGDIKSNDDLEEVKWYNLSEVFHSDVTNKVHGKYVITSSHLQMIGDLYKKSVLYLDTL